MFCTSCGKQIAGGVKFCPECGAVQNAQNVQAPALPAGTKARAPSGNNESPKSRTVAAILAFFLGGLGIHRFYVGKVGTGILQILVNIFFFAGAIWALLDLIVILCGNFKDSEGRVLSNWDAKY